MKKNIFSLAAILTIGTFSAQVRTVNSATNVSVTNSPAFIDASSNTTVNGSSNVGKGLIFPRVDLSAMTTFPGVTAGIPNSFPTRFDGMIVYNTAFSGTAGVGSTQGTLSPGYWYYENKTSSNTGGTWKPVSTAAAGVANTASNGLSLSGNDVKLGGTLSQATDIATAGNNLTISGTGNVGVGTSSPTAKLEINNGTTAGAIKITDGTQGAGKVLTSDANGLATWSLTPIKYASVSSYTPQNFTTTNTWVNTGLTITVPDNGLYYINFNARAWMSGTGAIPDAAFWKAQLRINDTTVAGTVFGMHASSPGNNADSTSSFSSVMSLNKNDVLSLWYNGTYSFTALGDANGGSSITIFRLGN